MPLSYFILSLFLMGSNFSKETPRLNITVVYFNTINTTLQTELLENITATYHCKVTVMKNIVPLPAEAYYQPRNRYRAPQLLKFLNTISGTDKVIGITTKDISTTSNGIYDWGVMGLGNCPGKSCVISTFRIKTPNKKLFNDRFIKVALHELGHTMGLPHCTFSSTCFMEAAEGTVKSVDRETRFLCTNCKKIINH